MRTTQTNISLTSGGEPIPRSMMPESFCEAFRNAATRRENQGILFIENDTESNLSYGDLKTEAERILKGLRSKGLAPGDPVIFQFERNLDFIRAFWGCLIGGFVPVPVATPLSYEEENNALSRIINAWQLLGNPYVLTDGRNTPAIRKLSRRKGMENLRVLNLDTIRQPDQDTRWHPAKSEDPALLMLTSGSTGMPKAVQLSHYNLLARSAGSVRMNGFSTDDISLNWMPLDHVGGIIYFHLRDIFLGARQIHAATDLVLQNPMRWLDWMDHHRVSITWAPNFAFSLMVDQEETISRGSWDLTCVRHIMNGGEAVVAKTGRRFLTLLEAHGLPGGAMHPAFGMAEISSGITYSHEYTLDTISDSDAFVAVGRPIPGVSLRIVDDRDAPVPEGVTGNLQVKGETLMMGYYNDPEKTREVFGPDGWFRTGDLGFLENGILTITGRDKDEIIVHGNNFYQHEIESAVEELPGVEVTFTAACAVRSPSANTDEIALFFCPSKTLDEAGILKLIGAVRKTITRKVGGARIHVIPLSTTDIPKTSLGKIQRVQLKRGFETGTFENIMTRWEMLGEQKLRQEAEGTAPQTEVESLITTVWKEVLDLPQLGIHHNFFELGGHSILLVQAHARLKPQFPKVTVTDFFKYPTAFLLARHLSSREQGPSGAQLARKRIALGQSARQENKNKDVAVIGMACRFPGAKNLGQFWENLKNGVESIRFFTPEELIAAGVSPRELEDPRYVKAASVIEDIDRFDADFFGFTPREAEFLDPQHRIFLETCWEALEDAGVNAFGYDGKIGLYAGASMNTYLLNNLMRRQYMVAAEAGRVDINAMGGFQMMVANDKDFLPTRIGYKLNLTGPCINVQTACSTSLVTINMAYRSVCSGECDMALAGGVSVRVPQEAGYRYQEGMIVSPDGRCRAFDADAQGTIFGSGSGVILLRPLTDAIRDKNPVYAVIKGASINNDGGMKVGYAAPSENGQAGVMAEALELAGIDADSLTYLEAHGTGTILGDPIEVAAMTQGLRTGTDENGFCAIGSVKPNIGHLQIASGVAGFIKTALMLHHKTLPPTINFNRPNPRIDFENSPFFVNTRLSPWQTRGRARRRAGVNSVGIGGTNAHTILEEAPDIEGPANKTEGQAPLHLLPLSAKTEPALKELAARYLDFLDNHPDTAIGDICYTASTGRTALSSRLALIVRDFDHLRETLATYLSDATAEVLQGSPSQNASLTAGFLFTGEAPPKPGDGDLGSLIAYHRILEEVPRGYEDIRECRELTEGYAFSRLLISLGLRPDLLRARGGGLLCAACVAGIFTLQDGLKLMDIRRQFLEILQKKGNPDRAETKSLTDNAFRVAESIVYSPPKIPLFINGGSPAAAEDLVSANFWIHYLSHPEAAEDHQAFPHGPDLWVKIEQDPRPGLSGLLHHLGRFFIRGGAVDWETYHRDDGAQKISLPTYPWQRQRYWVGAPDSAPDSTSGAAHESAPDSMADAADLPSPARIAQELAPLERETRERLAFYRDLLPRMDDLGTAYIITALDQLGWAFKPGDRFTTGNAGETLGIRHRHYPLLDRMLSVLAREGLLADRGPEWEVLSALEPAGPAPDIKQLSRDFSPADAQLDLFQRCGAQLHRVLTGEINPLHLLFPDGDLTAATRVYRDAPSARAMNTLVAGAVQSVLRDLPRNRTLRFLEIGAGTGSTTASILPLLPPDRTEYDFTDISPLFTAKAAEIFNEYPFLRSMVLDIENDPVPQGFASASIDVVIAANVLHATCDLAQTLDRVASLMAPGGLLLLIEETRSRRWLDLTFGLTEGWWRFRNDPLRPDSPLAGVPVWQQVLADSGFPEFEALTFDQQAVIIARTSPDPIPSNSVVPRPPAPPEGLRSPQTILAGAAFKPVKHRFTGEDRHEQMRNYLVNTVLSAVKLPEDQLEEELPLSRMGIDSLVAIELKNSLMDELAVDVPVSVFLGDDSINTLVPELLKALDRNTTSETLGRPKVNKTCDTGRDTARQIPLSPGQQALWVVHQTAPDNFAYNIAIPLRIVSALNPVTLRETLRHLWERHDLLRAVFQTEDGIPRQVIRHGHEPFDFAEIDASGWDEALLRQRVTAANQRPFDLENGPLFRTSLFRRSPHEHVLLITVHHMVFDGWSLWLFLDELRSIYAALSRDKTPDLPDAPAYDAFVREQQTMLEGPEGERLWQYWKIRLGGQLPLLKLPLDRPRPPVQRYNGGTHSFRLDKSLTLKLKAMAGLEGATMFSLLLTAYFILLHRYTGQEDLLVGTPATGRTHSRFRNVVGYFINPVIFRAAPEGRMDVRTFLAQVSRVVREAVDHQACPLPELVRRLEPERTAGAAPLFQTAFLLHTAREDHYQALFTDGHADFRLTWEDLEVAPFVIPQQEGQFDIALEMIEAFDTVHGHLKYDSTLFTPATAERMGGHLTALLHAMADDSRQPISALNMIPETEADLVRTWNSTRADYPLEKTVIELFEDRAHATPDGSALVAENASLTYGELNSQANRLARYLTDMGLKKEDPVGICLDRCPEVFVCVLAILKAGGAYVPLDPEYPSERLRFILEDAAIPMVLTRKSLNSKLPESGQQRICLEDHQDKISGLPADNLPRQSAPEHLAYLIYTSGTTGIPKGVMVTHQGIMNLSCFQKDALAVTTESRILQFASLNFDASCWEWAMALPHGAQLHIANQEALLPSGSLITLIEERQITHLTLPPSALAVLPQTPLPHLQCLVTAGESCTAELVSKWSKGRIFINAYGPTESTVCATLGRCRADGRAPDIGTPIANTRIHILDDSLSPVPVGTPGELCISGHGLARGYLNRPELTRDKFADTALSGKKQRIYKTGDRARWRSDGTIEYLGRTDHQIKLRGFRIELAEIEAALVRHDAVNQAAVVVSGRGEAAGLAACVTLNEDASRDTMPAELSAWLREQLPRHMVPAAITILDSLPLTPNGKIDRKALTDVRPSGNTGAQGPRNRLERQITEIWKEILHLDTVGIHDNFFDLGGHSLLLTRVQSRIEALVDKKVPAPRLFQYPTIERLAAHISGETIGEKTVLAPESGQADIAIIGISGRFPGAGHTGEFWQNLKDGKESVTFFSEADLLAEGVPEETLNNPRYIRAGAFLSDADLFDADFFGYAPREAEILGPEQRIFLECAWEAIENAGYDTERLSGEVGVFAGSGATQYLFENLLTNPGLVDTMGRYRLTTANDKDFLATRTSYKLNLKGPSINVQTACSTSLVAVHLACESLRAGACGMALAGGVSIPTPNKGGYIHESGMITSSDGHCRAFDAGASGTVAGNGAGIVVLKPLDRALADRDTVLAVIKGSAVNNDGAARMGYTSPGVDGQVSVITRALAGINPETITYVEAHGTGTELGDPVEIDALTQAYGHENGPHNYCALGSVKTNIGHLDAAAGVAGLIKTVLALNHRQLPPSLHFKTPNPKIDFDNSPFFVNTALRPWTGHPETPRRAGVSSFGMGGTNAHLILEEAPDTIPSSSRDNYILLPLSAATGTALDAAENRLARHLEQAAPPAQADVAYTLGMGRKAFEHRSVLVCRTAKEACDILSNRDKRLIRGKAGPEKAVVFLFPGQGTQSVNMLRPIYREEPLFKREVDRCCSLLHPHLGLDLRDILYPDEDALTQAELRLKETAMAQPALFVVEYALAKLWLSWGVRPSAMLGHSIGEYVAACLAGVFELADALALVAARGQLMQSLAPGAMLSVPMPRKEVEQLLDENLQLAAHNGPSRCVVSGPCPAVERLNTELETKGIRCITLNTSHAFHSAMTDPVTREFAARVRGMKLSPPRIPFVSNLTGTWITDGDAVSPDYWAHHLGRTVEFSRGVHTLITEFNPCFLEVGPGRTLSGLAGRHGTPDTRPRVFSSQGGEKTGDAATGFLLSTLGRLWVEGVSVDFQGVLGQKGRRVPLPTYPFQRRRYWIEPGQTASVESTSQKFPDHSPGHPPDRNPDPADWFYQPAWQQTPAPSLPSIRPESGWLVFEGKEDPGIGLIRMLKTYGDPIVTVSPGQRFERVAEGCYTINPALPDDYAALVTVLAENGGVPEDILHLWQTDDPGEADSFSRADTSLATGFYSLLHLARALGMQRAAGRRFRLTVVTANLHSVTGEESLVPERAPLLGAVKLIPLEYDNIHCRSVDVAIANGRMPNRTLNDRLVSALVEELLIPPAECPPVVALRGPYRWTRAYTPVRYEPQDPPGPAALKQKGVYLITGGLGGIGLTLAHYLADTCRARLILVGRSGPGNADDIRHHKLSEMEACGARVMTVAADVADRKQMAAALNRAEAAFGPVNGVIHAAGVVDHAGIIEKRTARDTTDPVLAPKVRGTLVLDALLENHDLDFMVLCSSAGNVLYPLKMGEVGYLGANEFLDAFCFHKQQQGHTRVIAINWDDWDQVGMSFTAARHLRESRENNNAAPLAGKHGSRSWHRALLADHAALSPEEGKTVFERILTGIDRSPRVVVSTRDLKTMAHRCRAEALRIFEGFGTETARPDLGIAYAPPGDELEQGLADIWELLLGIDAPGIHDDFFQLGGDSLLGTRLIARVRETWQVELPMQDLFNCPTIAYLARCIRDMTLKQNQRRPLMDGMMDEMMDKMDEEETGTI